MDLVDKQRFLKLIYPSSLRVLRAPLGDLGDTRNKTQGTFVSKVFGVPFLVSARMVHHN
jgi:hypothetical protein